MKRIVFLAMMILFCGNLWAAPQITDIKWQKLIKISPQKIKFADISELKLASESKAREKVRIIITLENKNGSPVEGAIIRCAFYMRFGDVWSVPFWLEERRVAKINPGKKYQAIIQHIDLDNYLRRLKGTGFWPNALKAEVMVEPRSGDDISQNKTESIILVNP